MYYLINLHNKENSIVKDKSSDPNVSTIYREVVLYIADTVIGWALRS